MEGEIVVVEPLAPEHEPGLFAAGRDREMWTFLTALPDAYETREPLSPLDAGDACSLGRG